MAIAIREQEIQGERALHLGDLVLVASKSEPGTWYSLEGGRCTCKGFEYRHTCRHLAVAEQARESAPNAAPAVTQTGTEQPWTWADVNRDSNPDGTPIRGFVR